MVFSTSYQQQQNFYNCVRSNDPNSFFVLLQQNPYHIDTLIQLSEILKQFGENDQAKDLIERF